MSEFLRLAFTDLTSMFAIPAVSLAVLALGWLSGVYTESSASSSSSGDGGAISNPALVASSATSAEKFTVLDDVPPCGKLNNLCKLVRKAPLMRADCGVAVFQPWNACLR